MEHSAASAQRSANAASSGLAAPLRTARGVGRVRTNCSGSISPPMTGGNCYGWIQKHYAKNCQLKKLPYETMPRRVWGEASSQAVKWKGKNMAEKIRYNKI